MINENFMQQISCDVNLAHISKEVTLRFNRKTNKFQCKCANTLAILEKIASRKEEKWMSSCEKKIQWKHMWRKRMRHDSPK